MRYLERATRLQKIKKTELKLQLELIKGKTKEAVSTIRTMENIHYYYPTFNELIDLLIESDKVKELNVLLLKRTEVAITNSDRALAPLLAELKELSQLINSIEVSELLAETKE